jgi:hypothetical protein
MVVDKRHPDYETFSADDKILEIKDLLKCSKVRTGRNKRKFKSKYTFHMKDLYNDGIHPNPLLAHLWRRKIQEIVLDKCF